MNASLTYNECELAYLQDEWLDPSWAAEICARTGDRGADDGIGNSIEEENWNIFNGS